MIVKEIVESSLLNENAAFYELSILLGMDSLVFAVVDSRDVLLALKHWEFESKSIDPIQNFKSAFLNEPLLGLKFKQVNIGYSTKVYTLIPEKLYHEKEDKHYLKNIAEVPINEGTFTDYIPSEKICCVFSMPNYIREFFIEKYDNITFYHSTTPLLNSFLKTKVDPNGYSLLLNFKKGLVDVILLDRSNLKIMNSFQISSGKDVVYFTLLIFQQFGLDQNQQKVWISGGVESDSDYFKLLKNYIPNLEFLNSYELIKPGNKFMTHIKPYQYFNILNFRAYTNDPRL